MMRNYAYMQGMVQLVDLSATIQSDEEDFFRRILCLIAGLIMQIRELGWN